MNDYDTEPAEREPLWFTVAVAIAALVLFCFVAYGIYNEGYKDGRQAEQKIAVEKDVAIPNDDGSIRYLTRPQLRSMR